MKSKIRERRGLGKLGAGLLSAISAKEKEVFTVKEAEEEIGMKGGNLRKLLFSLNRNGWIERIERGKYLILPLEAGAKPDYGTHSYIIAGKLANPYYIAFASALNYYGITEQVGRIIYIATLKPKLPLAFHSENYCFACLSKKRFFGVREEWIGNLKFNISDKEKTLIDCLYMPEYSGGLSEAAKAFRENLDYEKVYDYAMRMKDLAVLKRLGYLLDILKVKTKIKGMLLGKIAGGYCLLDTCGPKEGRKNRKWRVIENVEVEK